MNPEGVKQGGEESAGEHPATSLHRGILLAALAVILVGTGVAVAVAAWSVTGMKDVLVEQARDRALLAARMVADDIGTALEAPGADLVTVVQTPEMGAKLYSLTGTNRFALVSVVERDGNLLAHYFCSRQMTGKQCEKALTQMVPPRDGETASVPGMPVIAVAQPIYRDGDLVGYLNLGYSRLAADAQVARAARAITISLTLLCVAVFTAVGVALAILTRLFRRNLAQSCRAVDSEHLANLGVLATGLAHEIRNPLHAMNLHLDVVREDLLDDENEPDRRELASTLESVQRQLLRLNRIVSNFVNLSLPSRITPRPMNLEELIREVVAFLQPEFDKSLIAVELDLPEGMEIQGDPEALHQVLMNILINARQALESAPIRRVRVAGELCRRGSKGWVVRVEDSGPGIPEGEEEAIFRQFVAKRAGGTGFGLSLARHIMQGHGGEIHASRSAALGGALIALRFGAGKAGA